MKTKLSKILGVALTVALLSSLFVFAAPTPVSAGTLQWTPVPIPQTTTGQLVRLDLSVGKVACGPDGTLYAAVSDIVGAAAVPNVFRSPNGGYSWIPSATAMGAAGDIISALEVTITGDVIVAVQTPAGGAGSGVVLRSQNGGANFSQLGTVALAATEAIVCMSATPTYDGVGEIAIGISDVGEATAAAAATNVQVWGFLGALTWTPLGTGAVEDVVALKYSPSYPMDSTLVAAVVDAVAGGTGVQLRHWNASGWDPAQLAPSPIAVSAVAVTDFDAAAANAVATDVIAADIALPQDYDSTTPTLRRAYVSVVTETPANNNVFRIDVTGAVAVGPAGLAAGTYLWDLDYIGTVAAGTLMGGLYSTAAGGTQLDVWYSSTVMPPWAIQVWNSSVPTNLPTGVTLATETSTGVAPLGLNMLSGANICMADDFATSGTVYVGTPGTDSAFGASHDGGNDYNETGLIDNGGAAAQALQFFGTPANGARNLALSPFYSADSTIFMVSDNRGGLVNDTNVWRSQNGGATWDRVLTANFNTAGISTLCFADNYDTNGIVFVGDTGIRNFYFSKNQGTAWQLRIINAAAPAIGDMVSPDGAVLYVSDVAATGIVAKGVNGGWSWPLSGIVATGSTGTLTDIGVDVDDANTLIVGDNAGCVYRSTDANVSWAQVGTQILAANRTYVAAKGDQVYAQLDTTGDIYRWDIGVSPVWYGPDAGAATGFGITISKDNTLYAFDPAATANNQIRRSIEPTWGPVAPVGFYEWMAGMAAVVGVSYSVSSGGSNDVGMLETTNDTFWMYGDTLSAGSTPPTLLAPANEYQMPWANADNFSVENQAGVTNWNLWFSNDPNFINNVSVATVQTPPSTLVTVNLGVGGLALNTEAPVYWMARADTVGANPGPLRGPWSESRVVIPQPTAQVNAPAGLTVALNNAGTASVTPVLSWTGFKFASGYNVQVAKGGTEIDFETPVIDVTIGATTSYFVETALAYDSAYAFRVQAIIPSGLSDWSYAVGFKTEAATVEVFTCPQCGLTFDTREALEAHLATAHAPTTPLYIWIVIAVGAILVIAVIWLIFTTRRS